MSQRKQSGRLAAKPAGAALTPNLRSRRRLTGAGIRWEAAAQRQLGGPGEGWALPRFSCSPSPAAAGEGAGG